MKRYLCACAAFCVLALSVNVASASCGKCCHKVQPVRNVLRFVEHHRPHLIKKLLCKVL